MIKCPSCGYENVDGTQFCEGCGEELPAHAGAAAPAAAAAGGDQMIKCPACDNMNPAENLVCEVCGTELHGSLADAGGSPAGGVPSFGTSAGGVASAGSTTPFDTALNTPDATPPATGMATTVDTDTSANVSNTADASTAPAPDAPAAAVATGADATAPAVGGAPSADSALGGSAPAVTDTGAGSIPDLAAPVAAPTTTGGELQPGRVKLTVEQGMSVGKQFVLGDNEMQVGREDEEEGIYPDLDLSDQDEGYVHRRHATLNFANGQLTVTHLGGANKTRVNNRPLPDNQPQPVNVGDKIAFGKVVLRVQPHP